MHVSRLSLLSLPLLLLGCPSEDPDPAPTDDDDAVVVPGNSSPTAPELSLTPATPGVDDDITCAVDVESVDADGDAITYTYAWLLDDEDAGVDTATLPSSRTGAEEWWTCLVSASDGALTSSEASATVEVGHVNQAPSAPTVDITPDDPSSRVGLNCEGSDSEDLEGNPVTYSYSWETDGADAGNTTTSVDDEDTLEGEEWTCIVTASDGELETSAEASVTIGPACYSLDLDGTGYVDIDDDPALRLAETDFTVEGWVRRTGSEGAQHAIAYKRDAGSENGWGLYIAIDTPSSGHAAWVQSGGSDPRLDSTSTQLPGTWLHVAYTFAWDSQANEGTGTLFVDGLPAGSDILPSPSHSSAAALNLGRDPGFDTYYLEGQLDDVRISSVVRYDGLFAPAAQSITADADTIGLWRLEEGTGAHAADSGPNGFHGTVVNGAWTAATSACSAAR
jgi:hypothetical protein